MRKSAQGAVDERVVRLDQIGSIDKNGIGDRREHDAHPPGETDEYVQNGS